MAEELLDQIVRQLRERTREARAAYQESQRLERALAALETEAGARASSRPNGRRPARRRPQADGRARRGANREAILAVVRERPGATAREISDATGIVRATVASTVTKLAATGVLVRSHLPAGGVGFRHPSA